MHVGYGSVFELVSEFFKCSTGFVSLSFSFVFHIVYYADVRLHAGLARGHSFHLSACLHVLQSVDHLPKYHFSGRG